VKVVVFLAESAVVRDGRVDFLGVGWQMAAPDFSGCVVGIVVEVIPCPIPPATLQPHSLYTVRVAIDGSTSEDWSANFYTWGDEPPGRPAAPAT
jgi:hypothetical protein